MRKRSFLILFIYCIFQTSSLVATSNTLPAGGLKFSSYEQTKDLRTGLNLTPDSPIHIGEGFQMEFDLSFWRLTEAYGHIFRIITDDGTNIDLVSSPYSAKLNDLTLIIGDSASSIEYSFSEINLSMDNPLKFSLIISPSD